MLSRYKSILLLFSTLLLSATIVVGQKCLDTKELLLLPGKLLEAKSNPFGSSELELTPSERVTATKNLNTIKSATLKNFKISGGIAKIDYRVNDKYYFGSYFHRTYKYSLTFYMYLCVNGKQIVSDEYGNDLAITINPDLPYYFKAPSLEYENGFYADPKKFEGPTIGLFSYLVFENKEMVNIIQNGVGYVEENKGGSDAYDKAVDIFRTWYIPQKGKKPLIEVTRKEYLENLLEFYERERISQTKKYERLMNESTRYMAEYEKSGNKAMYQSHLENKNKATKEIEAVRARSASKAATVSGILKSNTEEWLKQPAQISPQIRNNSFCDDAGDFKKTGYFTFRTFYDRPDGNIVYKWSPEYFNQQLQNPAVPLLLSVRMRYKRNSDFSSGLMNDYIKNLDFDAISKILLVK